MDDLDKLAADLFIAGEKGQQQSYKALVVEAHNMRDEWRAGVTSIRRLGGLPPAIGYDVLPSGLRAISAEVGFDPKGQGKLDNIVEYGTSSQGPIRPMGAKVLKDGADRLTKYLEGLDPL